jgi:signal transduction histidine kinase/ligand-binding sensor domain-containing protein
MGRVRKGLFRFFLSALKVWLPTLLFCVSAMALDPSRRISQYAHTAWRIQDGAFSGTPNVITQTTDGYLWVGTEGGLVRFDGVRFVPWTPSAVSRLSSSPVFSLLGANDGSLWIGTGHGLYLWKDAELANYSEPSGLIDSILQDRAGTVWIVRTHATDDKGPLCEVRGNSLRCYGAADGIPFRTAGSLANDDLGNLWIGSSLSLCQWRPGSARQYFPKTHELTEGLNGVTATIADAGGFLWVGMRRSGKGLGLQQLVQGIWKSYVVPGLDGTTLEVSALLKDRNNGLWIGTFNQGVYRVQDGKADHFRSTDGLSSDSVNNFYEDREGDLWVITSRGIDRFHDTAVASFSIREGLTAEAAGSVLAAHDGTIWIGDVGGLNFLRQGKVSAVTAGNGFPGQVATSLLEDHAGLLWVGVDGGLTVYEHGKFRPINKPDGNPLGVVTAIVEDSEDNIWAEVTQPALFRIQDYQVREEIDPPRIPRGLSLAADPKGGIWLGFNNGNLGRYRQGQLEIFSTNLGPGYPVRNLLVDTDGSIWAATGKGLLRWKQGSLKTLNSLNGLPCDSTYAAVKDDHGSLWLDAQCGFLEIAAAELEKWWERPDTTVKVKTFDVFDGVQPGLTNFRPEVSRSPDGKLWFANKSILQVVDPGHLGENVTPPPVHVEQIIADQKNYLPEAKVRLPARTRNIEIDYTALSFVVPEKVRFRYQLEGHDAGWQDSQTRRQSFYNDLPPGNYHFRVIASNNDGVWNEMGASQAFTVLPAFFQTTWFRLLCCITAAGILWLLYALRLRQLATQMEARLEERLEERERIARDLHDTLLQGFFSATMQLDVANDRLPPDSPAKPLVHRVIELMNQVGEQGRNAIRSLRSSHRESYDLEQAFSQIRQEFPDQESVDFRVVAEGSPRPIKPGVWDEIYRLGREAVMNAFRHSQASKIEVEVRYAARHLRILVRDNGRGIDPQVLQTGREGHWGLSGMRERAERIGARMAVLSRPDTGTDVKLSVPSNVAFESVPSDRWPKWLTGLFQRKNGNKSSTD